jgi:PadR family transcriptional regulator PadR
VAKRQTRDIQNDGAFDASGSRSQWLKGVLEVLLLSVVDRAEAYGYEIGQQLRSAGMGEIKGGTLYPRLAALERAGLVEVEWRAGENGPGRKYYRATEAGRVALAEARSEYRAFSQAVDSLLYEVVPSAPSPEGLAAAKDTPRQGAITEWIRRTATST